MQPITFDTHQNVFFNAIKKKVDHYFQNEQIDRAGNRRLYIKGGIQFATAILMYVTLVFFTPVNWVSLLICGLLGLNLAIIGFNVMHEGGHQSFSKHTWLNKISAHFLNVLGGSAHFWKVKHNVNHHTFTNVEGIDSDIDAQPFMRMHPDQPRHWMHRFQHVYAFLLYGISYMAWVFYEDFTKYFSGRIAPHMAKQKWTAKEHFIFWATKTLYVGFYIVVPIFMLGWLKALVGFFVITFVCGLFISVVFQLAHVVEETHFPIEAKKVSKIEQEWAIHQVTTTANFATSNKVLFWLLGGLNFQIEHHLFPRVSHIHYPAISKLVRETCREYSIAYNEHTTMMRAFLSHLFYLRRLGTV